MPSQEFWKWLNSIETRDVVAILVTISGIALVFYLFCHGKDELAFRMISGLVSGIGGYSAGRPNSAKPSSGEEEEP